jgi:hypothetical protein
MLRTGAISPIQPQLRTSYLPAATDSIICATTMVCCVMAIAVPSRGAVRCIWMAAGSPPPPPRMCFTTTVGWPGMCLER